MPSIRLIFGRTRARRLAAIDLARAVDVVGRPVAQWIVGTEDQRTALLQPAGAATTFAPTVWVFDDLLAHLWHRHGDGRAVMTQRQLTAAARHVLRFNQARWPRLARMGVGDPLAAQLAHVAEAAARHGADRLGGRQLDDALATLGRHLASRPAHIRPSSAHRSLIARLEAPDIALQHTLRRFGGVVIEGLLSVDPLSCRVALALARAWAEAGVQVVFSLAWGRDRGGREAGIALGWDDADPAAAHEARTFAATASLRRALFDLVASGIATAWVATPDGPMAVEPWTEPGPPGPMDLADALAEGSAIGVVDAAGATRWLADGRIRLQAAADIAAEAAAMAADLKARIRQGADPADCRVVVADLAASSTPIAAALRDAAIPHRIDVPLAASPVAAAVRAVVHVAVRGPSPLQLCTLAQRSDLDLPLDPRVLRRALAQAGIGRSDAMSAWSDALRGWLIRNRVEAAQGEALLLALDQIRDLALRCAPLSRDAPASTWRRILADTLARLGIDASCHHPDEIADLHAVYRLTEALARDLGAANPGPWPAKILAEQLDVALQQTPRPSGPATSAVRVVDLEAMVGIAPRHTWVLSLNRGSAPAPGSLAFLAPAAWRPRLGPDRVAEGRYVLADLLRTALSDPDSSLTLSWFTSRDGRTLRPSPLIVDLLDLPTDAGVPFGQLAIRTVEGQQAAGRRAAWRLAAADRTWLDRIDPEWATTFATQAAVLADRRGPLGPRDGILTHPPAPPAALSVTALENYLRCPQRYWYEHVLGLTRRDAWAPELEARRRGTALHQVLEAFLLERGLAPLAGQDPEALGPELHTVASAVLDRVEAQGGFDPVFQAYARSRWLAGLVDRAPGGILKAWLREECAADPPRQPVGVEAPFDELAVGQIQLRGVLDRLDRLGNGALVVTDYKTGRPPARRLVAAGLALQPYAYAEAVARAFPDTPVVASFLSLARPDALRRTGWVGDPATLDAVCTRGQRAFAISLDAEGRRAVLDRAGQAAAELIAGRFPTTALGPDLGGCRSCPHARLCRVDHPRRADP